MVRFRFACEYVHRQLVREFFEHGFVNPDEALGHPGQRARRRAAVRDAPTPDDRFEVKRVMAAPSFEGVRLQLRYRDRSIEDEVRRLALTKTALIGFIDVMLLAGLYLVFTNVRRELRLSRLKSDFVANVSHELKTPLALIRLFAETLELRRVPSEEKAQQYYRVINKESQRLTQLINNILDFSRIEAGRKEYRFVPTDIGAVVKEVVEAYRFPIEQQGFEFEVTVADDLPGDRGGPGGAVAGASEPRQQRHQVQRRPEAHRARRAPGRRPRRDLGGRPRESGSPRPSRRRSSRSSTAWRTL